MTAKNESDMLNPGKEREEKTEGEQKKEGHPQFRLWFVAVDRRM